MTRPTDPDYEFEDIIDDERDNDDDPRDPRHPDHDLSESMPYSSYEPPPKLWFTRRLVLLVVAVLAIAGLMIPYLQNIF
jgi:hypothetical protein